VNDKEQATQQAFRIPDEWLLLVDAEADRLSKRDGLKYTRSSIYRIAIARYLGVTSGPPNGQDAQTGDEPARGA